MLIEQPPFLYRMFFPGAHWRLNTNEKVVFLTFDDGPIPEMTPWVLDLLDKYNIKAVFFCVGDNVRKYPEIYQDILNRGHRVGNHTFRHLQGLKVTTKTYLKDVEKASQWVDSKLFRPPHGHIRLSQFFKLRKQYSIVLWDVVTRDYSCRMSATQVLNNVKKYTRNGSIIVFHDSIKGGVKTGYALPLAIQWLLDQGYQFRLIEE